MDKNIIDIVSSSDYDNDITINLDIDYTTWAQDYTAAAALDLGLYEDHITIGDYWSEKPNDITFNAGPENDEMLKITADGFYVRGVLVPQDAKEAEAVYKAFRQWMTWNSLTSANN